MPRLAEVIILLEQLAQKGCEGPAGAVYFDPKLPELLKKMTPKHDVENALAFQGKLAEYSLEDLAGLKALTFPMRGRKGMFEIRCGGVRIYGGRVASVEGKDVLFLAGAEQKAGKSKASAPVLDSCESKIKEAKEALS